jgi:hypothetical protein
MASFPHIILNCNHIYFCTQHFIPHHQSPLTPSTYYCQTDAVVLLYHLTTNICSVCFFSSLTFRQYIAPQSAAILEKITVHIPPNKVLPFYINQSFSPCSQEPATCPYTEPDESSPRPSVRLLSDIIYFICIMYSHGCVCSVLCILFHCVVLCIVCV